MNRIFSLSLCCLALSGVSAANPDAMRVPALRDVRLGGHPGAKMSAVFRERMQSDFARKEIFGEARRAFETRDDDIRGHGGLWRGEFWGKLMLGTARAADYLQDPDLLAFVRAECHRLMALQDADGYLGSYADRELVSIVDPEATRKTYGWYPCWNLWNRKYCIWGMLMAYKATGDREILSSVGRQMDQWIDMLHRKGLKLYDTGTLRMYGLPSMSVLKPLLMLYRETGKAKYIDYAREMLPDWDRADGACPNFFRNATRSEDLADWYPEPFQWAKCYEMMSCLDGLLEWHRATGDARALGTVKAIRDNLERSETNPFGGVGFGDKFLHAARRLDALSEVCDAIHWIRLNLDLFEITGEDRYMDSVERAYLNNFLPGVFRRGDYGAFFLRGQCRHENQFQCGFAYNHCCVNNVPRTFLDVAEGTVTEDGAGVFHVNLYQDATVTLDGRTFEISGDYPVGNTVTVKTTAPRDRIWFRRPGWCGRMSCDETAPGVWTLVFDMPARLVERDLPDDTAPDSDPTARWMRNRYADNHQGDVGQDVRKRYRRTPAATLWRGPLLLAKAKRVGCSEDEIFATRTVNRGGYAVAAEQVPASEAERAGVWGAWDVTFSKPGTAPVKVRVCDFESAGDDPRGSRADAFSIWF